MKIYSHLAHIVVLVKVVLVFYGSALQRDTSRTDTHASAGFCIACKCPAQRAFPRKPVKFS